jgi:hypothetical protein
MKRILFLMGFCAITFVLTAQNFYYKSALPYGVSVNDAVELNGKFYMVGNIDSAGVKRPYSCVLDATGKLVFETVVQNLVGQYVNIHKINNTLHTSSQLIPIAGFYQFYHIQIDTNFVFLNSSLIGFGIFRKSKLINDSIIVYAAYQLPGGGSYYNAGVYVQNILNSTVLSNTYSISSLNPFEVYDIVSPANGVYHLYTSSPDSLISDQVSVHIISDSLRSVKNQLLKSSYNQFTTTSRVVGTVSAEFYNNSIVLNAAVEHPTYQNQFLNQDLALIRYDTNYNELNLSFSGRTDTNYTTSRNSVSVSTNKIISAGNTDIGTPNFEEIIINEYDLTGNLNKSVHYTDGNRLELKKVLQLANNQLLIIGNTGNQFFAIKVDSLSNNLPTGILEMLAPNSIDLVLFPNPAQNWVQVNLNGTDKLESYQLLDIKGQLLKSEKNTNGLIPTTDLSNGFYLIRLRTDKGVVSKKLIISK